MHNSKLLRSLRQLSGRQLTRFEQFVASPYFNKPLYNVSFFMWLRKYAPDFSSPQLKVDHVLKHCPFEEAVDKKNLSYRLSHLNALLERFLAIEQMEAQPQMQYQLIAKAARDLEIEALEQRATKKMQNLLDQHPWRSTDYYRHCYELLLDQYLSSDPHDRSFNPRLQAVTDRLDAFYVLSKLQYLLEMKHHEAVSTERYTPQLEAELLSWLATHPLGQQPAILVYRLALRMVMQAEQVEHYYIFKATLEEHQAIFPPEEQKQLFTVLLNYCVRRNNRYGEIAFLEEYLHINDLLIAANLLLDNGELSPWRYVNLKNAALNVGRDDWAWEFIHQQRSALPPEYRDNVFYYALAYIHFHRGRYEEAQQVLAQVTFEDLLFNVALRTLLTRVYFEAEGADELLEAQLEANRLFLLRHKKELPPTLYEQWRNFQRFCVQLLKTDQSDRDRFQEIGRQIEAEQTVLYKDWLLRQVKRPAKKNVSP